MVIKFLSAAGKGCNISLVVIGVRVGSLAVVPGFHLGGGGRRAGVHIGDGGVDHGGAAVFGGQARHAAEAVVGVVSGDGTLRRLGQSVVLVIGIGAGVGGAVEGLGLGGQVVLVVVAPLDNVAVAVAGLLIPHESVQEIVAVAVDPSGNTVGQLPQVAVGVVGVRHGAAGVAIGHGSAAAKAVIAVGHRVAVAVDGPAQPPVLIVGIAVGDQGAASGLHRRGQVEHPVGEAVIRAGGGGNGGQQILAVGIVHCGSALLDLGGAVFRLHSISNKNSG